MTSLQHFADRYGKIDYIHALGLKLVSVTPTTVRAELIVQPKLLNSQGFAMNGGISGTIIETLGSFGSLIRVPNGVLVYGATLVLNHHAPAQPGALLTYCGTLDFPRCPTFRVGERKHFWRFVIATEGELVSTGSLLTEIRNRRD